MIEEEIQTLHQNFALQNFVDEIIEQSLQKRQNLSVVMSDLLPKLCEKMGAEGAFLQSFGEDLNLTLFSWPEEIIIPSKEDVFSRVGPEKREEELFLQEKERFLCARALDVVGEWFGCLGLVFPSSHRYANQPKILLKQIQIVCEALDNFLFSIRAAREKHQIMMKLHDALRHRVIGDGIRQAVQILAGAIPLDKLLLVYVPEEGASEAPQIQMFDGEKNFVDTMNESKVIQDKVLIQKEARAYLLDGDQTLLQHFGLVKAQEEVLINGITHQTVVGKIIITPKNNAFNTHDRELLAGFAGFIRQRVVDFNKEWRRLAASFRYRDVAKLLQTSDYENRFLAPREEDVAILYTDIAGFTRLSEQVLKSPSEVAKLVEIWSRDAVRLVWKHGGVFDKMVGDCIIALFGPPFYQQTPGECLQNAIHCAIAIRDMTKAFSQRPGFEMLRKPGIGVATGVNLAPLFVGCFGPNRNFTGFSSGMNNTARLQGCAKKDEILVMADTIEALPVTHGFSFGDEQKATVKNVAFPLRYKAIL